MVGVGQGDAILHVASIYLARRVTVHSADRRAIPTVHCRRAKHISEPPHWPRLVEPLTRSFIKDQKTDIESGKDFKLRS